MSNIKVSLCDKAIQNIHYEWRWGTDLIPDYNQFSKSSEKTQQFIISMQDTQICQSWGFCSLEWILVFFFSNFVIKAIRFHHFIQSALFQCLSSKHTMDGSMERMKKVPDIRLHEPFNHGIPVLKAFPC